MSRNHLKPMLLLLAAAALTGPLPAQRPGQEPPKAEAPSTQTREVAKKAAHFEAVYRDRIARIDRLIRIYTAKGDRAKVTELEALRESQVKRHANAMEGFRKQLGPEAWGRMEKEMQGARARKGAEEGKRGEKPEQPKEGGQEKERPKDKPPARPGGKN